MSSAKEILERGFRDASYIDDDWSARHTLIRAVSEALAALDAEGVGLPWVSVDDELPDEEGPDVLVWNTKWGVDVLSAIDLCSDDKGWYWLPLSAIPQPGQSGARVGLREATAMIRAWPCVQQCDDGVIPVQVGDSEWEPQQCQFCDERNQVLAVLRAGEEQSHE